MYAPFGIFSFGAWRLGWCEYTMEIKESRVNRWGWFSAQAERESVSERERIMNGLRASDNDHVILAKVLSKAENWQYIPMSRQQYCLKYRAGFDICKMSQWNMVLSVFPWTVEYDETSFKLRFSLQYLPHYLISKQIQMRRVGIERSLTVWTSFVSSNKICATVRATDLRDISVFSWSFHVFS